MKGTYFTEWCKAHFIGLLLKPRRHRMTQVCASRFNHVQETSPIDKLCFQSFAS